jgi:hypothetical protein
MNLMYQMRRLIRQCRNHRWCDSHGELDCAHDLYAPQFNGTESWEEFVDNIRTLQQEALTIEAQVFLTY